jgi:hypothetical protein
MAAMNVSLEVILDYDSYSFNRAFRIRPIICVEVVVAKG